MFHKKKGSFKTFFFIGLGSVFFLALLTYKMAGLFSLYPNDWFLDQKVSSAYYQKKTKNYRFICQHDEIETFKPYLEDFSIIFGSAATLLKKHEARPVYILNIRDRKFFLKSYNVRNFFHWAQRYPLRSSHAFRSWHYGLKLLELGIPTPKPLALYEQKIGPFWKKSIIITEYLENSKTLQDVLEKNITENSLELFEQIQNQLNLLKKAHLIHADYGLRNLLLSQDTLYLIDLDDVHYYHFRNHFFYKRFKKKHGDRLLKNPISPQSLKNILNTLFENSSEV